MAIVKEILTQGANIKKVTQPFIVSTGKSVTKAQARALGIDVDVIAKYTALADTAHIFPLFNVENINVCKLDIRLYTIEHPDNDTQETLNIEITGVEVDSVIAQINAGLSASTTALVECTYRNNRLHLKAMDFGNYTIQKMEIIDSRGDPNKASVNDTSNVARLFNYFYPDKRGISSLGDLEQNPPREENTTSQSIGVSQGEPRSSESLNRNVAYASEQLDRIDQLVDSVSRQPEKVRIPLTLTADSVDLPVNYAANSPPKALISSWSGDLAFGNQGQPAAGDGKEPKRGGVLAESNYSVTVIALRGVSIAKSVAGQPSAAKVVNKDGQPFGLVSPDGVIRGGTKDTTVLDRGAVFPVNEEWKYVGHDVSLLAAYTQHVGANNAVFSSRHLNQDFKVAGDGPIVDGTSLHKFSDQVDHTGAIEFTLVDSVTIDLAQEVPGMFEGAIVRIVIPAFNDSAYLLVREWINSTRCIVSEIPKELANTGYYPSMRANLEDLASVNKVFFRRGPIVPDQEWSIVYRVGTGGYLRWLEDEDLYLEVDVISAPNAIDGKQTVRNFQTSTPIDIHADAIRKNSPTARRLEERVPVTLKGLLEAPMTGVSLKHATGAPFYDINILNPDLVNTVNSSNMPPLVRDQLGVKLIQQSTIDIERIVNEVGTNNPDVLLTDANFASTDPQYKDGIDEFLFNKFEISAGDTRYPIMRKLTLMFATGSLGTVSFSPSTLRLQSDADMFSDELLGLMFLLRPVSQANNQTDSILSVTITCIIDSKTAEIQYTGRDYELPSTHPAYDVFMYLLPRNRVAKGRHPAVNQSASPALSLEGLSVVSNRSDHSPTIEVTGDRPLEASSIGQSEILAPIKGQSNVSLAVKDLNGLEYIALNFTEDAAGITYDSLPAVVQTLASGNFDNLGGLISEGTLAFDEGLTTFHGINPQESAGHVKSFLYEIIMPVSSASSPAFPSVTIDSENVIVVVRDFGPNTAILGLLLPIPSWLTTEYTDSINVLRKMAIIGQIKVKQLYVSVNKDKTQIANPVLVGGLILDSFSVKSNNFSGSKVEVSTSGNKSSFVARPEFEAKSSIKSSVAFAGASASAELSTVHDYPDIHANDSATPVRANLVLGDGTGNGVAAQVSNTLDPADGTQDAVTDSLLSVSSGLFSASVHPGGFYGTSPESRAEDLGNNLTGFDHRELSGDLNVNHSTVKDLCRELDDMKQREFNMLKQLSYHAAMHHEALDMLRTAKSSIKQLRNVQYELIMSLIAVADVAKKRDSMSDPHTVRFGLQGLATSGGNKDLSKDLIHRLTKSALDAGHLVKSGLNNYNPTSHTPSQDLSDLVNTYGGVAPLFNNTHNTEPGWNNVDPIPLDYVRPGYNKITTSLGVIGSQTALDPSINLFPVTETSEAQHPLYTEATYAFRNVLNNGRENISWSDALEEFDLVQQHAVDAVTTDMKTLVSSVSPAFTLKPRAEHTDNIVNEMVAYVMGIGFWSVVSTGSIKKVSTDIAKSDAITSGWAFVTDAHRMVGPTQVALDSDSYCWSDNDSTSPEYIALMVAGILGTNANLYTDNYIRSQISNKRDLVFGVSEASTPTWTITIAPLLGFPSLYKDTVNVANDLKESYTTFDIAAEGDALFYTVDEDTHPVPVIPGIYDHGATGEKQIAIPVNYEDSSSMHQLSVIDAGAGEMAANNNLKVVYLRAWCVARRSTEALLLARLAELGYEANDPRVKVEFNAATSQFVAVRTKLGMSDLFNSMRASGLRPPAASGQLLFSFREYNSGVYLDTQGTRKRSNTY